MICIFWGTGKIGKRVLMQCRQLGFNPDFFTDNNSDTWGCTIDGITVISPETLLRYDRAIVFITCADVTGVSRQLADYNIKESYRGFYLYEIISRLPQQLLNIKIDGDISGKVVFLLDQGAALGGAEAWSLQTGEMFQKQGRRVEFLLSGGRNSFFSISNSVLIPDDTADNRFEACLEYFLNEKPGTVICNFPGMMMDAAIVYKRCSGSKVRLIAVIHNDEPEYYDNYTEKSEEIDHCMIISKKMLEELKKRSFPDHKIVLLPWRIDCKKELIRSYSGDNEPIRIGYAGRIVIIQKRVDLLLDIAVGLRRKHIPFKLSIAGAGDYLEELKIRFERASFENSVNVIGAIPREDILGFWEGQDICLSCSEWEGRSISKAEAMAGGAVPVLTNTSGVEDDIVDGQNGYIVPIGDIKAIIDRIEYLYHNKNNLIRMGSNAHRTIIDNNAVFDFDGFWRKLID